MSSTRAREDQFYVLLEEVLDIADGCLLDNAEVARAKLRVDARKWYITKISPKKYSDKITTALTGKDGGPIQYADITDEELNERLKDLGYGRNRSQLQEKLADVRGVQEKAGNKSKRSFIRLHTIHKPNV